MLIFIGSFILTVIAASVQATNWILVGNTIKPDLVLIILIILGIINPSWIRRIPLVLTAALILKFAPGLALLDFVFIAAATASILLMDFLPWQQTISLLSAVAVGTIITDLPYLTLFPLIYKLILNLLLAFILFVLSKSIHAPQIKLQRNRF